MFKAWSTFWAARSRKRREEKLRQAQNIEDTFSERLASRNTTGRKSSKIDVGFTSQQTLNHDPEGGERRPTFSRFLKLWKGLRNSKRKPANDETRRGVVFTIPTEDVFPKTRARQQTYHLAEDPENQVDVFNTHLCQVHRVTHHITENYSNHDLHHLEDDVDTVCENERTEEMRQVEITTNIKTKTNNESGSSQNCPTRVGGKTNKPDRKTSDEKYLQGKEEGKSFSKESDVDSGCGSSCHEIYTTESQTTHAQLNVSSLAYYHAQKAGFGEYKLEAREKDKDFGTSLESKVLDKQTDFELCDSLNSSSNEQSSQEFKKAEVVSDSFEELIKLAKDGMSTLARKRVDKPTISDRFDVTKSVDTLSNSQDSPSNTDEELQTKASSLTHSATDSEIYLDARKVDSGVKCAYCTSLCVTSDNTNMNGEALHSNSTRNKFGASSRSGTCVIEIPTITVDSEAVTVECENAANVAKAPCLLKHDSSSHDLQGNNDQFTTDNSQDEPNRIDSNEETLHSKQKIITLEKQNDLPLKIVDSLLKNYVPGNAIRPEKAIRPQSMVLQPTNKNIGNDKTLFGLKAPSLETLNLPSDLQPAEHTGRIRSFSATVRRKLSFRERVSSDDMDIEKPTENAVSKDKKLKGFRSFRTNRKKKTKASKAQEISQSTGCLEGTDSKTYWSTFDKIFYENTESVMFTDVPFTIPEISEP